MLTNVAENRADDRTTGTDSGAVEAGRTDRAPKEGRHPVSSWEGRRKLEGTATTGMVSTTAESVTASISAPGESCGAGA